MKETHGFSDSNCVDEKVRELGLTDREDVRVPRPYAEHFFSREKLLSFSYTEGDTTLIEYDSIVEFEKARVEARAWYIKNDNE